VQFSDADRSSRASKAAEKSGRERGCFVQMAAS
jgi:hypothetical protein